VADGERLVVGQQHDSGSGSLDDALTRLDLQIGSIGSGLHRTILLDRNVAFVDRPVRCGLRPEAGYAGREAKLSSIGELR